MKVYCNQVHCKHHAIHSGGDMACEHWQEEIAIQATSDPYENTCCEFELHEDAELPKPKPTNMPKPSPRKRGVKEVSMDFNTHEILEIDAALSFYLGDLEKWVEDGNATTEEEVQMHKASMKIIMNVLQKLEKKFFGLV